MPASRHSLNDFPVIVGGDPFNLFRGLYPRELWWRLNDPDYCLDVMRHAYAAGARAYELSFSENVDLFRRLRAEAGDVVGFANPTWKQGVMLNGRFIQYSRDRVLRTIVEKYLPARLRALVENHLRYQAPLVFDYDHQVPALSSHDLDTISLNENHFRSRLGELSDSTFALVGGTDADWLFVLGRPEPVVRMVEISRAEGFRPLLLCHYASLVVPMAEEIGLDVEGYAVPINRMWSWFTLEEAREALKRASRPIIAFMPLAGGKLAADIRGAFSFLYHEVGVVSVLVGFSRPHHARETVSAALEAAARCPRKEGLVQ